MKTKFVPKTKAQIRAEFDAMPEAKRSKHHGMSVTVHGGMTRLRPGMVIEHHGEPWNVETVNECRAVIRPVNKQRRVVKFKTEEGEEREFTPEFSGSAESISPNSECKILRWAS